MIETVIDTVTDTVTVIDNGADPTGGWIAARMPAARPDRVRISE